MKEETTKEESLLRPKAGALSVKISKQSGNPHFAENTPIRTELLAQTIEPLNQQDIKPLLKIQEVYNHVTQDIKEIDVTTLLKIEKVAIHLEGKGKQPNTIDSFRRHINVLARRTDLGNPPEVELAIARYKLTNPFTKELTKKPTSNNTKPPLSKNTSGSEYTSLKGTPLAPKDSVFAGM